MINPYAFPGLIEKPCGVVTYDVIEEKVCELFNVSVDKLFIKTRKADIVAPRQVCMYLAKKYVRYSTLKLIGDHYGGFDHTTIVHSIKLVENRRATEKEYDQHIDEIELYLKGFNPFTKRLKQTA
ncbi:hypothetical protein VF04_36765 [Nostoc linckia z7]|uniref:Chromosomal replication initiator DnaA C-terminal domain-containing protein n=1 Tax=Nostoc linckia z7 TaxID=1628745 RepID=A0ABX4KBA4_NOSLI|nr:helix-turn-helix domain-containing protein [Nostoc linckia]PHJ59297.1 hypothetical protein VF05_32410 [Nostoc linckia z3]PHJ63622.1 hypothetical protein VF03_29920 [Nostoc linckia z2]PHJ70426.1 hypothetical protein VF06_37615 [Nostoc linckia z4]PHJ83484.1 hypothetical protein VF04_36765 [Nostoc linckia z7]